MSADTKKLPCIERTKVSSAEAPAARTAVIRFIESIIRGPPAPACREENPQKKIEQMRWT